MNGQYYMVPLMQGQGGPMRMPPGMAQSMGYPGGGQIASQGQSQYMSGMSGPSVQTHDINVKKEKGEDSESSQHLAADNYSRQKGKDVQQQAKGYQKIPKSPAYSQQLMQMHLDEAMAAPEQPPNHTHSKKDQPASPSSRAMSLPTAASYYESEEHSTVPYVAPPHYQTIIECGHVNKLSKRTHRLTSEFFGKEVDIYMAVNDPKRRILYRSSLLSELFMCATNQVGMYMARRRTIEDGIYQATTIRWKPAGRLGLKAGARRNGYFLTLEVCKSFGRHHRHHSQKCRRSRKRRLLMLENKLRDLEESRVARASGVQKVGKGISSKEAHDPNDKLAALLMLAETTSPDQELSVDDEKTLEEASLRERAELLAEEDRDRRLDANLDRLFGEEEREMLQQIDDVKPGTSEDELYEVELTLAALGRPSASAGPLLSGIPSYSATMIGAMPSDFDAHAFGTNMSTMSSKELPMQIPPMTSMQTLQAMAAGRGAGVSAMHESTGILHEGATPAVSMPQPST
jgi:hypothetical protein